MSYEISAKVVGHGIERTNCFWCFEPTYIVLSLRERFPTLELKSEEDSLLKLYLHFVQTGAAATAVARNDVYRRSPVWVIRLHDHAPGVIKGKIERFSVDFRCEQPFTETMRSSLLEFCNQLCLADYVTVKSIRREGNDEYPV
jgi:hypothetical protein